jgi:ribonucleoside-diphosphate reductase alpha chain
MTWLNEKSRSFLSKGYVAEGQTAEERIRAICETAEGYLGIKGFSNKLEEYILKGWVSLSSPVWANYGLKRGLPASCNSSLISDTMESILSKVAEIASMTKYGAGTSAYFGNLRPRGAKISTGGESSGPVHFMELFDKITSVISQSSVRRGSMAAYLPVDHPDIHEFLKIRSIGNPIQDLSIGVCISDEWMKGLLNRDKDKLKIWGEIIKKRFETGYPYIVFTDTANNNAPDIYKKKNKKIYSSNLCNEIFLSLEEDESYVCVLSSVNLLHYDEWKDTDLVETLTYFLDTVTTEYINKTESIPFLKAAHNFSKRQRAIGLGVLGWHSFLQSKNIAFESMEAKFLNVEFVKLLNEKTLKASKELAKIYGEPDLMVGTGERMATRMAFAPTVSSSQILGQVSQGIEPQNSNYFVRKLAKGNYTYKNPYLKVVLKKYEKDTSEVWKSILEQGGSVQHLSFLSDHEKDVFKTFGEISQKEIVIQGFQRQKHLDQGQSLNLMIHPKTPPKEVSQLLIFGWENGIKGFYYQKSYNPSQELTRSILECKSCEG